MHFDKLKAEAKRDKRSGSFYLAVMKLQRFAFYKRDVIVLNYTVFNDLAEPIYLMDQMYDYYGLTGKPELNAIWNKDSGPTRELANIFHAGGQTALFYQGWIDEPSGSTGGDEVIMRFAPRAPLATKIDAGGSTRGEIRARMPLREWHVYEPPSRRNTEKVAIKKVTLKIEYMLASAVPNAHEHPSFKGSYRCGIGDSAYVEGTVDLTFPCDLYRRKNDFDRSPVSQTS